MKAEEKALEASQIGVPLGKIDRTAREVIEAAGYGDYFMHRIGHGLGIEVHEFPSLASNIESLLQKECVIQLSQVSIYQVSAEFGLKMMFLLPIEVESL